MLYISDFHCKAHTYWLQICAIWAQTIINITIIIPTIIIIIISSSNSIFYYY